MGQSQRKIKNYVKTATLSKGYYLHVFAGGITFLGILMLYASRLLGEVNLAVGSIPDAAIATGLQDRLMMVAILYFVSFMIFLSCTVFYMIILGQRVGGPIVAICAYIQELRKGNFDARRELRKNDELGPILIELKHLARELKAKAVLGPKTAD